ncbi:TetR/AcrR family transcriptional regulator [Dictyobacter aurantiacus]|uniref:TetR family transcriptional regulator n=1 Tax=Dictyobacter aurantiacus TaxID=1936993 RepID=A0A401ZMH0_9CHLR|nr:TetR/AcrR family transcriptional regulator [Dictyobacter aurantiacus]GCE08077.1 TetR family transcriptional regulator [Dictyobacter aurantiacus]
MYQDDNTYPHMDAENIQVTAAGNAGSEDRRQEIVLAAFGLIASKGVEGLRTRDVAAGAGMNIGTLYYYFSTKEKLIQGVVDYIVQHIAVVQDAGSEAAEKTPVEVLHQHLAHLTRMLIDTPEIFRVMGELILRSERDQAIYQILKQADDDWQQYLINVLVEGINQRLFRADLDPALTAHAMMSFFKGAMLQLCLQTEELERTVAQFEGWLLDRR